MYNLRTVISFLILTFLVAEVNSQSFDPMKTTEKILNRAEKNAERKLEQTANTTIDRKMNEAVTPKKETAPKITANAVKDKAAAETVEETTTTTVVTTTTTTTKTTKAANSATDPVVPKTNAVKTQNTTKPVQNTKKPADEGKAHGSLLPPSK
jgi:hypothetical protein